MPRSKNGTLVPVPCNSTSIPVSCFFVQKKNYQNLNKSLTASFLYSYFNTRFAPPLRVLADEDECHKFELKSPTYTHFHQGGMFENHVLSKLTAMH